MRDAVVAAHTLNIFNKHCDKIRMANVAQLVNNLHALFLASGDQCIVTPTYHVFDFYQGHQGAESIETIVTDNDCLASSLSVSASCKDGKTLVTICNLSCKEDIEISLDGTGFNLPRTGKGRILAHETIHAHNTFDMPDTVIPREFDFDPSESLIIPRGSIVALQF